MRLAIKAVGVVVAAWSGGCMSIVTEPPDKEAPPTARGLSLRYAGFFVEDVPKTAAFYEAAFGLKLRYMHPTKGYSELETGDTLLAFTSEAFLDEARLLGQTRIRRNRASVDPVGAQIALVTDDMDAAWKRATGAGAQVIKEPEAKPWGQVTGYLRDVNGVLVELCTRSPRDFR
jgi:uncharacterized glyoxalase superfamily protein PhnB